MDTNRYMSITVQALVKQCVNCGTKEAVSHYAKVQKYNVVLFNVKMVRKWQNLRKISIFQQRR